MSYSTSWRVNKKLFDEDEGYLLNYVCYFTRGAAPSEITGIIQQITPESESNNFLFAENELNNLLNFAFPRSHYPHELHYLT